VDEMLQGELDRRAGRHVQIVVMTSSPTARRPMRRSGSGDAAHEPLEHVDRCGGPVLLDVRPLRRSGRPVEEAVELVGEGSGPSILVVDDSAKFRGVMRVSSRPMDTGSSRPSTRSMR